MTTLVRVEIVVGNPNRAERRAGGGRVRQPVKLTRAPLAFWANGNFFAVFVFLSAFGVDFGFDFGVVDFGFFGLNV
jgi:hypothetical protein